MFRNLIESSSHAKEFKRRGSFLLFTTATYIVLFVVTGVVSIYAYDAHLGEQSELELVMEFVPPPTAESPATANPQKPRSVNNLEKARIPERAIAMESINQPVSVPVEITTMPNKNLPLPPGPVMITGRDIERGSLGGPGSSSGVSRQVSTPPQIVVIDDPPPPASTPKPVTVLKTPRVLNSEAISLPKPAYPIMATRIGLEGTVAVQVLIDETGKVISAKALSGHPIFSVEAQRAALRARFSPTVLNDQPVKVSGMITYNFKLK